MSSSAADLIARARQIMERTFAALQAGLAEQGSGLDREIAAQVEIIAAATDQLALLKLLGGEIDPQPTVTVLCNALCLLSGLYGLAGRRAEAAALLEKAQAVAEQDGDDSRRILVGVDAAGQSLELGHFSQALAALLNSSDRLAGSTPGPAQISPHIRVGKALSETFSWIGDTRRAMREIVLAHRTVRRLQEEAPNVIGSDFFRQSDLVQLRFQLVIILLEARRFRSAGRVLETVAPIYERLEPASAATMPFYRAKILEGLGDPLGALALVDTIRPVFEGQEKLAHKRGALLALRARLLTALGRHEEALADGVAAARLDEAAGQQETEWQSCWQEARVRSIPGQDPLPSFDRAVEALDRMRRASLGYRLDSLYLRSRRGLVDEAVRAAFERGDAERCLRYADAVKSRYLAAALAAGPPPVPDKALVERLDRLGAKIDAARADPHLNADALRRSVAERAAILERMRLQRPPLEPPSLDPAALADELAERCQAALQLYLTGDRVFAVLIHDRRLRLGSVQLSDPIQRGLAGYTANLRLPGGGSRLDYVPDRFGISAADLVPRDLLEEAAGANALLISAHGLLNLLPWPILRLGTARLVERVPVASVPNVAAIGVLARRPAPAARIALFGDPAGADLSPAERLADLAGGLAELANFFGPARLVKPPITREGATLPAFRTLSANPAARRGMLHLACHGTFDYDDPAGSGLKLTGRRLTAAELALRPLPFAEVTMAACSTGVRPERAGGVKLLGDDLLGLPAAALEAGAGSVLVSTTPAGDAASRAFFTLYYGRRLAGDPPIPAFAAAQRALLAEGRHALRHWAGFTLYAA